MRPDDDWYAEQIVRFLDDMHNAGRDDRPFAAAMETAADYRGVVLVTSMVDDAEREYERGRVFQDR